jgi:hypothetical protein
MKDFIWFLETVDTGVDIGNYPRTLYQGSLEPGRHRPRQEQADARGQAVEEDEMRGENREGGTQTPRGQDRQEGRARDE